MARLARRPLVRQGAGVLAALLAGALFAPQAARASCGDYVVLGDRPAGAAAHAHPVPMTSDTPPAPTGRHAPCNGPLCSRHRPHQPLPPVAPVTERVDQWGCVGTLLPVPEAEVLVPLPGDAAERPVRHGQAVYHPPR